MSTMFFCICDSIASMICGRTCQSISEIHEAGTSCVDASITNTFWVSLVQIVLICVIGFLLWKLMDHVAHGIAGFYKRKWEVEDIERKMKADLKDK